MQFEQPTLRLTGTDFAARNAQERADRFNEAVQCFIDAMNRASSGLKNMGESWERAPMIVATK
ncbi:MAG: hypothetical protein ACKVZJ_04765 [Phycisphaerales bacterium]